MTTWEEVYLGHTRTWCDPRPSRDATTSHIPRSWSNGDVTLRGKVRKANVATRAAAPDLRQFLTHISRRVAWPTGLLDSTSRIAVITLGFGRSEKVKLRVESVRRSPGLSPDYRARRRLDKEETCCKAAVWKVFGEKVVFAWKWISNNMGYDLHSRFCWREVVSVVIGAMLVFQ